MADFSKLLAQDERSKQRYAYNRPCNPLGIVISIELRIIFLFWIVGGISCHQNLFAQTDLGSITGTIRDGSGAAIPNCQVEIKNARTNAVRIVMTDANGFYSAPSLTVGPYNITATAKGFRRSTQAVTLTLGGLAADLQLEVGDVSLEITVTSGAESMALQTDSHDLSVSVSSAQLVNLPNNGRSVLSIATLGPASQPGTDSGVDAGDETFYGQLASSVIISGLGNAHTLFLQDGVDNTNLLTQTANNPSVGRGDAGSYNPTEWRPCAI
jgi:hypothetical protein